MVEHIRQILRDKPELTREIVIILGVIQLCKIMDVSSFQIFINQYKIKSNHWWPLINEIAENEDFLEVIEGPLYEEVLKLQIWLSDYEHDVIEGSVLWNVLRNPYFKK